MAKYVTRGFGHIGEELEFWEDEEIVRDITVCDHEAVDTGLVDASGGSIYRLPNGIGFNAEID
ncbi:MAG: hypothetical protein AAFW97_14490 [Pseudomonadota bacterium]